MTAFTLSNLAPVHSAIDTVTHVHGAYRSVELLAQALEGVEVTEDFDQQMQQLERQQGVSYQGPGDAGRTVVKAVKTAEHASGEEQDAILQLVALVIERLGLSQGTRVMSIVLAATGLDPRMIVSTVKLSMLLARTSAGRRVVEAATPLLQDALQVADPDRIVQPARQLAEMLGDKGTELVTAAMKLPGQAMRKAASLGSDLLDGLQPTDPPAGEDQP